MQQALVLAKKTADLGALPVGAVVVKNGVVIGEGWNLRETNRDPLHHAEIMAIQEAAKNSNAWRLSDTTLYVTLEPCFDVCRCDLSGPHPTTRIWCGRPKGWSL